MASGKALPSVIHSDAGFPRLRALELSQLLLMMAWKAAGDTPESAHIVFGMSPPCLRAIRGLTLQSVQQLA